MKKFIVRIYFASQANLDDVKVKKHEKEYENLDAAYSDNDNADTEEGYDYLNTIIVEA